MESRSISIKYLLDLILQYLLLLRNDERVTPVIEDGKITGFKIGGADTVYPFKNIEFSNANIQLLQCRAFYGAISASYTVPSDIPLIGVMGVGTLTSDANKRNYSASVNITTTATKAHYNCINNSVLPGISYRQCFGVMIIEEAKTGDSISISFGGGTSQTGYVISRLA